MTQIDKERAEAVVNRAADSVLAFDTAHEAREGLSLNVEQVDAMYEFFGLMGEIVDEANEYQRTLERLGFAV